MQTEHTFHREQYEVPRIRSTRSNETTAKNNNFFWCVENSDILNSNKSIQKQTELRFAAVSEHNPIGKRAERETYTHAPISSE